MIATVKLEKKKSPRKKSTTPCYVSAEASGNSSLSDFDLNHEILIVVRDKHGNEHYSKVIVIGFDRVCFVVVDQGKKLSPGIYQVTGSEDYRLDQCKIKVEPATAVTQ